MKKVLGIMLVVGILLLPVMALAEGTEVEIEVNGDEIEEIGVLRLPEGVEVILEPDERIPIAWWRVLDFDVTQDFNTRIIRSFIGFSFGNGITDFSIGYSKEFDNPELIDDQGTANFSFSWSF